ncbi:DUF5986 family protein [Priestia megaterium]|uniref:DUF5986 family protein n=1 Tax=Priestia megaterium TaxID=1404 RepID=UPI0012B90739|nr:DUF5986 family protein [Priestia megaterium]
MVKSFIKLTEDIKKRIVESIHIGNEYDYKEFIGNKRTTIRNGTPYNRMDFIYESLMRQFSTEEFTVKAVSSGNWQKHLQIYHKPTKTLCVVVKEERIQSIRMKKNNFDRKPHYVESYSLLNENKYVSEYNGESEQLTLNFSLSSVDKGPLPLYVGDFYTQKKSNLFKLIGALDVETFVLIPIIIKEDKIFEVKAHIPQGEFSEPYISSEDWSNYIPVPFTIDTPEEVEYDIPEEIQIGIKKKILEKDSVSPSLKKGNRKKMDGSSE